MRRIFKTLLIIIAFNLIACDQNNDIVTPTNGFTVGSTFYETPNCYIEFDEDNQSEFNLFFLNGRMHDNTTYPNGVTNDYLFTLNTTNFVFYNIRDIENPSIITPSYPNIQTGITYVGGNSDTVILSDGIINDLGFTSSGFNFGQATGGTQHTAGGTIVINSYNYNPTTQTGSINVDYQGLGPAGNVISGHYEGNLGVILD